MIEILDAPDPRQEPSPLTARARAALRRLGHDPDGLRQFLLVLHRAVGARAGGEPPDARHRGRGGRVGPERVQRGHPARAERQFLRARHHTTPAALRRSPPRRRWLSRASGACASPVLTRRTSGPRRFEAMAETPEVCEQLHLPLQSGSDRVLRAMRRGYTAARYLERLAAARSAVDDLAVTTDIIVGFPGESEDDFEETLHACAEAAYDSAFTFVFSPRPGTRAAAMESDFVATDVVAERFERLKTVIDRSAPGPSPGAGRAERRGARRGRQPARRGHAERAYPPGEVGPLPRRARRSAPWSVGPRHDHLRSSSPPHGPVRRGRGAAAPPPAHPRRQRVTAVALVGVTAAGKSGNGPGARPAPGRLRHRLGRLHVRLSGHGHRHVQTRRRGRVRWCPTTCSTWSTPTRSSPCRSSKRPPARPWPQWRPQAGTPCWSVAPGCTTGPSSTIWPSPAATPTSPPRSKPSWTRAGPSRRTCTPACVRSIRWRRLAWLPPTGGGSCAPWRSHSGRVARSPNSGPGSRSTPQGGGAGGAGRAAR